jgi:hypothetical protein
VEGETQFFPVDLGDFIFQQATHLSRIHKINEAKQRALFIQAFEKLSAY